MLVIDGSYMEGGGQIIRTSIALSAITGKPCRIINIRVKRPNPGLQAQHLTVIRAVKQICNAKLAGAEIGSTEIDFTPCELKNSNIKIDVGTAGAVSLVLQSIMILAFKAGIAIEIKGGTFVKWSPPMSYIENVTLPMLCRFGYKGIVKTEKHGFYPKGGGLVGAKFDKSEISPISIIKRGKPIEVCAEIVISKELEKAKILEKISKYAHEYLFKNFAIMPEIEKKYVDSPCAGGGINIWVVYESSIIGASAIAEPKISSQALARNVVNNIVKEHNANAPVDEHLQDQLVPYMALATCNSEKDSIISISKITAHTKTNIWVCEKFLPVKFEIKENIIKCSRII